MRDKRSDIALVSDQLKHCVIVPPFEDDIVKRINFESLFYLRICVRLKMQKNLCDFK